MKYKAATLQFLTSKQAWVPKNAISKYIFSGLFDQPKQILKKENNESKQKIKPEAQIKLKKIHENLNKCSKKWMNEISLFPVWSWLDQAIYFET